jgi:hypothetical protein
MLREKYGDTSTTVNVFDKANLCYVDMQQGKVSLCFILMIAHSLKVPISPQSVFHEDYTTETLPSNWIIA